MGKGALQNAFGQVQIKTGIVISNPRRVKAKKILENKSNLKVVQVDYLVCIKGKYFNLVG